MLFRSAFRRGAMRKFLYILSFVLATATAHAGIFGQVRGVVHDPQHRPIAGASVVIKAANSAFTKTAVTAPDGSFSIPSVPLGDYIVTVSNPGFGPAHETLPLASDTSPILNIELQLGSVQQTVNVE